MKIRSVGGGGERNEKRWEDFLGGTTDRIQTSTYLMEIIKHVTPDFTFHNFKTLIIHSEFVLGTCYQPVHSWHKLGRSIPYLQQCTISIPMSSFDSTEFPTGFFLPTENFNNAINAIALSAIVITITHLATFHLINSQSKRYSLSRKDAFKASYQLTNLLVNFSIGIYGLHECMKSKDFLFSKWSEGGIADHVFHHENFYLFPAFQVGYNLWSLPVGILYVKEPPSMIVHHISVIIICSLSATSHFGFRIHAPYFLGMFELSSVPLAVVNYLKDHHDWTVKHCKGPFMMMKILFAVTFVSIRIVLGTPHMYHSTKAAYWATFRFAWGETSFNSPLLRTWVGFVLLGQMFMALLQYWWAYLIGKAVARIGNPKTKSSNANEKKTN